MTTSKAIAKRASPRQFILNCKPSPKPELNWTLDTAVRAGLSPRRPKALPASVDHRAAWWPVGHQGETGSCVGWGTADAVLRWHFVKAGRLAKTEALSVRFLWMAAKETDVDTRRPSSFIESDGTWLSAALDISRKYGVVTEDVLPFQTAPGKPQMYLGQADAFYAQAATRRIASYFNLGRSLPAWRRWLAENGPILTRLNVDDAFYDAALTNGKLEAYDAATPYGGHCIALVGYKAGRFIVRNSWGTGWGDKGFAYASDAYAAAAFTEAFGVTL